MKKRIALILALVLALVFSFTAFADFGDYGGDYDYGGGDYDSGGWDYDSGDNDSGGFYFFGDNDNDNDTTTTTAYYSYMYNADYTDGNDYFGPKGNALTINFLPDNLDKEGDSSALLGFMALVIIATIILCVMKKKKNTISRPAPVRTGVVATDVSTLNPMYTYLNEDPKFSEQDLKEKISNIYVKMQNSWQDKNLDPLRPYLTDAFFAQTDRQLDAYRRNRQTNYIERIAVLSVNLKGWQKTGEEDTIIAEISTRIVDYVADDETGNLIRGSKTAEKFMTYEWSLTRKSGVVTEQQSGVRTITCPHCGANVDINKSAVCEFCDSILTVDSVDWVVSSIKGLSQKTVG